MKNMLWLSLGLTLGFFAFYPFKSLKKNSAFVTHRKAGTIYPEGWNSSYKLAVPQGYTLYVKPAPSTNMSITITFYSAPTIPYE